MVSILSRDHRERFSEFFSNVLRAGGLPEAVFNLAINGVIQLCVSEAILAEYEEVLRRERLAIPPEKVATMLARIRERGSLLTPTAKVDAATCPDDPDDLIFLECAEAAAADYLITGNRKHFPDRWKMTRIVSVREFWETIADLQMDNPI